MPSSTSSSDPAALGAPTSESQDSDYFVRPTPAAPWLTLLLIAVLATAALTAGWEVYWRAHWLQAGDFKNSTGLWAEQRRRATNDATILIGTSRQLFDIDLDTWEAAGRGRPVQLALEGTSPRMFLTDLANDDKVRGLVVVDVMAPIFFTSTGGVRADVLAGAKKETPSQWVDHQLSNELERYLAYLDNSSRPHTMIFNASLPLRPGMVERLLPRKLSVSGQDRNTAMWERVVEDQPYRELAKRIWADPGPPGKPRRVPPSDAQIEAVISEVKANMAKIRARGGDVVFVRHPYAGFYQKMEDKAFPRERFWDRLITETGAVGVTFQDHPEMQGFPLPEWSHLAPTARKPYTAALVHILYGEMDRRKAAKS